MRAVAVAVAIAATEATADQSISPGKEAIYASASNVAIPTGFYGPSILSGQILKGKRRRVLEITMTFSNFATSSALQTSARATVNGLYAEPTYPGNGTGWGSYQNCQPVGICTTTSRAFLDIDAAELAFPGLFVGQPLNVAMAAFQDGSPGVLVYAVLEARLQKK
jgi:hypothetical protein